MLEHLLDFSRMKLVILVQAAPVSTGEFCTMALNTANGTIVRIRNLPEALVYKLKLRRWCLLEAEGLGKRSSDSRRETFFFESNTRLIVLQEKLDKKEQANIQLYLAQQAIVVGQMGMMPLYPDTNASICLLKTQSHNIRNLCSIWNDAKWHSQNNGIAPIYFRLELQNDSGHSIYNCDGTYGNASSRYKVLAWDVNQLVWALLQEHYGMRQKQIVKRMFLADTRANKKELAKKAEVQAFANLHLDKPRLIVMGTNERRRNIWYPTAFIACNTPKQEPCYNASVRLRLNAGSKTVYAPAGFRFAD